MRNTARWPATRGLWHRLKGPALVFEALTALVRPTYDAIAANYVPGETILVGSSLASGAGGTGEAGDSGGYRAFAAARFSQQF